ncbi:MBL fold metallo-hydrolase [Candidatus Omnitrophota bacterium]
MNIIIHRGTQEIGGTCVEFRTGKSRLLIDLGMPLVNDKKEPFDSRVLEGKSLDELKKLKLLPEISGLYRDETKEIEAILISHSHLDHYGFLRYVHPDIPIYMSKGAKQLIKISNIFIPNKVGAINSKTIDKGKKVKIGDFVITPYLVDHSAFDARAFLVEAEGKRVFYSGDFRGHGRKSMLFRDMINNPPEDIDCLLMEGSMLGREPQLYETEEKVQAKIAKILRKAENITFLFASSQNIDRLVSAYKACLRIGAIFVIDIYTAFILDNLRKVSIHIPQFDWKNIRIKFLKYHADVLAKAGYKDLLFVYNRSKIDMFEINRKKSKILMLARDNSIFPKILKSINNPKGSTIIYSMWEGYLTDKFKDYYRKKGLAIEHIHTSGHATREDLKKFAKALNPKALIPIHTFFAEKYKELFKNVEVLKDGQVLDI